MQKVRGARNEQSSANTHIVQYFILENVKGKNIYFRFCEDLKIKVHFWSSLHQEAIIIRRTSPLILIAVFSAKIRPKVPSREYRFEPRAYCTYTCRQEGMLTLLNEPHLTPKSLYQTFFLIFFVVVEKLKIEAFACIGIDGIG